MILHAESKCTWRSQCGKYQIVHSVAGFGVDLYAVHVEGVEKPFYALTLGKAQQICEDQARLAQIVPETTFADHADMQR